jgi:hypothetical protein
MRDNKNVLSKQTTALGDKYDVVHNRKRISRQLFNIPVIWWRSALLVDEAGVHEED